MGSHIELHDESIEEMSPDLMQMMFEVEGRLRGIACAAKGLFEKSAHSVLLRFQSELKGFLTCVPPDEIADFCRACQAADCTVSVARYAVLRDEQIRLPAVSIFACSKAVDNSGLYIEWDLIFDETGIFREIWIREGEFFGSVEREPELLLREIGYPDQHAEFQYPCAA